MGTENPRSWIAASNSPPAGTPIACSFCGKSQNQVKKLFASPLARPGAFICSECVLTCNKIAEQEKISN